MKKKIYLACPYSHPTSRIRKLRTYYATVAAGRLMKEGHLVFSPLSHSDPIADLMDDIDNCDFGFWLEQDLSMLVDWADELWVLKLWGWDKSKGIKTEINTAMLLGKPVEYLDCLLTDDI